MSEVTVFNTHYQIEFFFSDLMITCFCQTFFKFVNLYSDFLLEFL